MNNKIIAIIVAVVVIGGGAFLIMNNQSQKMTAEKAMMMEKETMEKDAMMAKEETMKKETMEKDAMMKKDGAMMEKDAMMNKDKMAGGAMMKGGYMDYDASKLSFAEKGKVVLFFKASWCPSCIALDADINKNIANIPSDVLILKVDYDNSADLKKKYGVVRQHTLVQVDATGAKKALWAGSSDLKALLGEVK
jgi:thiol-disulfide isomerase/thioredoxin